MRKVFGLFFISLIFFLTFRQSEAAEIRDFSRVHQLLLQWSSAGLPIPGAADAVPSSVTVARCGTYQLPGPPTDKGYSVFLGDIDNDGTDDYTIIQRCTGMKKTDLILGWVNQYQSSSGKRWKWNRMLPLMETAKLSQPDFIDSAEFPRKMPNEVWVIPFRGNSSWVIQRDVLGIYDAQAVQGIKK